MTLTGNEPSLSGAMRSGLYEAWSPTVLDFDTGLVGHICLGVFEYIDAIKALLSYAKYNFHEESSWDGHQITFPFVGMDSDRKALLVLMRGGWSGGYLHKQGVPRR